MIDVLKDTDGKVTSYIEWTLTNGNGQVVNGGEFLYVYELWTHKRNGSIPKLIKMIYDKTPTVKWVYWKRYKYKGRLKLFPKKRFERRGK